MSHPCGQIAQLVEQRTENPRVGGSIPPLGTTFPLNYYFRMRISVSWETPADSLADQTRHMLVRPSGAAYHCQ